MSSQHSVDSGVEETKKNRSRGTYDQSNDLEKMRVDEAEADGPVGS